MKPPVASKTDSTFWASRFLLMAAATAPAPTKPPSNDDAKINSGRPERCLYESWNRVSPVRIRCSLGASERSIVRGW